MFRPESDSADDPQRRSLWQAPDGSTAPEALARSLTRSQKRLKRCVDIVGAAALLIVLSPVYLALCVAVQVSMGCPVHFWHNRVGEGGKRFRFYKFRSMLRNSEGVLEEYLSRNDMARTQWDTFQKLEADPRITFLGRLIRKSSLDELPQLWNVLKGDMSLVGPRPCMERQRSLYGQHWGHYCSVKPGITGLWQVSGRNRLSYAQRVALDVEYVHRWSLWLDIRILLRTVRAVAFGEGSG
ncbi:sugar transferase [Variovorax sp. PBL-E5]|uniref:sugar transferase n=1 Tax=Variovorax sp. PBL-E5 TaxID=434014 RepID=UPI001316AF60|nr:sugar transferase [Variovorax sp. PBL-E5]VTU22362.1 putative sugar transferase EpsL [Variovorax sp. PBL-E5]